MAEFERECVRARFLKVGHEIRRATLCHNGDVSGHTALPDFCEQGLSPDRYVDGARLSWAGVMVCAIGCRALLAY